MHSKRWPEAVPPFRSSRVARRSFQSLLGVTTTSGLSSENFQPRVSPPLPASTSWTGSPRSAISCPTLRAAFSARPSCWLKATKLSTYSVWIKGDKPGGILPSTKRLWHPNPATSSTTLSWRYWHSHKAWDQPMGTALNTGKILSWSAKAAPSHQPTPASQACNGRRPKRSRSWCGSSIL